MENTFIDPMWYIVVVGYFILNFLIKYFIKKYKEEKEAIKKDIPQKKNQTTSEKKGGQSPQKK